MNSTIKINPKELEDSSSKIKSYAGQFDDTLNDISKTLLGLECFWMGQSFFEFQGEFNSLIKKMKEVTDYINGISENLNSIANNTKQLDLQQAGLLSASGLLPSLSDTYKPTPTTSNEKMTNWDKVGTVAKTVGIDILGGGLTAVGGVYAIRNGNIALGGTAIVYGANSVINGFGDLANETTGYWGDVGETNLLQDSIKSASNKVIPNKDVANYTADSIYIAGSYVSIGGYKGVLKSIKNLGELGSSKVYQGTRKGWKLVSSTVPPIEKALNTVYAPISNGFDVNSIVTGADNLKNKAVKSIKTNILEPLGVCENKNSKSVLSTD